jgi:hypothetical protein
VVDDKEWGDGNCAMSCCTFRCVSLGRTAHTGVAMLKSDQSSMIAAVTVAETVVNTLHVDNIGGVRGRRFMMIGGSSARVSQRTSVSRNHSDGQFDDAGPCVRSCATETPTALTQVLRSGPTGIPKAESGGGE